MWIILFDDISELHNSCSTCSCCCHYYYCIDFLFGLALWSNWIDSNKKCIKYNSPEKSYNPNRTSRNPQAYVPVCSIEWPDTVVIWVGIVAMCPVIWKPFVYQRLPNCPSDLINLVVLCCHRTMMMIVQLLSYVFVSMKSYRCYSFLSNFVVLKVPCCLLFHLHSINDFECQHRLYALD